MQKFMNVLVIVTASLLCGCLGKMERIADETKEKVNDTNAKIEETHKGQTLGAALTIVIDSAKAGHMRVTAAETVIMLAQEDRLIKYLGGAPGDFRLATAARLLGDNVVVIPNVSYVHTDNNRRNDEDTLGLISIEAVDREKDLYFIWERSLRNLAVQFYLKSNPKSLGAMNETELTDFKKKLDRVVHASTVVFGSVPVVTARRLATNPDTREFYHKDEPLRRRMHDLVLGACRNVGMPKEELDKLTAIVKYRLGVN